MKHKQQKSNDFFKVKFMVSCSSLEGGYDCSAPPLDFEC